MATAIIRSLELGCYGRVRLEALSGAETFYQGLGMKRQPDRSPEGNSVYILEAQAAKQLLEQIKEKGILGI